MDQEKDQWVLYPERTGLQGTNGATRCETRHRIPIQGISRYVESTARCAAYVATQASLIGNGSNATQLSRKTSPQISANVCPATLKISLILHLWFSQSLNEYQCVMRKSETQKCRSPFHVFVCQHTKCQSRYKHYKVMFFKMLN